MGSIWGAYGEHMESMRCSRQGSGDLQEEPVGSSTADGYPIPEPLQLPHMSGIRPQIPLIRPRERPEGERFDVWGYVRQG